MPEPTDETPTQGATQAGPVPEQLDRPSRWRRGARERDPIMGAAAGVVLVVGIGFVLALSRRFMVPFTFALLLAVAFNPASNFLQQRWRFPNWLTAAVALLVAMVVTGALATIAYFGVAQVIRALPEYVGEMLLFLISLRERLGGLFGDEVDLVEQLLDGFDSVQSFELMRRVLANSLDVVGGAALTFLFLLFFVAQRRLFRSKLEGLLVSRGLTGDEASETLDEVGREVGRYLWLKTAISAVTGGVFGLAAWAGGTPFPLLWAFVAFAFNYAPSIGPIVASVVPIILTLLVVDSLPWAIAVSVVLAAIQLVSGTLIEPKLVGDGLNLNVITVFLSLLFWGLVWGPMGMLLGAPLTAVIQLALSSNPRTRHIANLMSN